MDCTTLYFLYFAQQTASHSLTTFYYNNDYNIFTYIFLLRLTVQLIIYSDNDYYSWLCIASQYCTRTLCTADTTRELKHALCWNIEILIAVYHCGFASQLCTFTFFTAILLRKSRISHLPVLTHYNYYWSLATTSDLLQLVSNIIPWGFILLFLSASAHARQFQHNIAWLWQIFSCV